MDRQRDLELILRSRMPIIVIETRDENRMLHLLRTITISSAGDDYLPLFRWTITDGLQRLDIELEPQLHNSEPPDVLRHIRAVAKPAIYVLLDFHRRLTISKNTLESRIESLNIIQHRFDKGIISELDVNQAQIQKEIAAAAIPLYERSISKAENGLSILLGRLPDAIRTVDTMAGQPLPPEIPVGMP